VSQSATPPAVPAEPTTSMGLAPRKVVFTRLVQSWAFNDLKRIAARIRRGNHICPIAEITEAYLTRERMLFDYVAANGATETVVGSRLLGEELPDDATVVGLTDGDGTWLATAPQYTEPPASLLDLQCSCGLRPDGNLCQLAHEVPLNRPLPMQWELGFDLHVDIRGRNITRGSFMLYAQPLMFYIRTCSVHTDEGVKYLKNSHGIAPDEEFR
jgi:hypothetical protein